MGNSILKSIFSDLMSYSYLYRDFEKICVSAVKISLKRHEYFVIKHESDSNN